MNNPENIPDKRRSFRYESANPILPSTAVRASFVIRELYTKIWLAYTGRFPDLMKYSHTTDPLLRSSFEKEADVRVRGISGSAEVVGDFFEISVPGEHDPMVMNIMREAIHELWRHRDRGTGGQ
jgi:hypothetical protein